MQIDDLELAFANTGRLVQGVRADQWTASTPCAEWDLRTLVNHTTWVVAMFGDAAQGRAPAVPRDADVLGGDPVGAYKTAAGATLAAWRERGLDGTVQLPPGEMPAAFGLGINVTDTYVHGWDIARATGQDAALEPGLCAALLDFMPNVAPAVRRGDNFGPVVDVGADAPVVDRLLGFCGRRP
jgi:uncharacterized protein (TIGR03086 family)